MSLRFDIFLILTAPTEGDKVIFATSEGQVAETDTGGS